MTRLFHWIALLEGLSSAVLFFIAMPLKYWKGHKDAVAIPGMIHGILFVLFCALLGYYFLNKRLSFKLSLWGLFCAILPAGTFFFDKHIRQLRRLELRKKSRPSI